LLVAEYSATRKISIDPNNYLTNQYPHLRWESDGYEAHIHHAGPSGLLIESDIVDIRGDLDVTMGGKIWAADLTYYTFGNDRNLYEELENRVPYWVYEIEIDDIKARLRALENA